MEAVRETMPDGVPVSFVADEISAPLTVLTTEKDRYIEEAAEVLTEAAEQGFECVLVIGFKEDKVHCKHSAGLDMPMKLGLLEAAKLDWWSQWK